VEVKHLSDVQVRFGERLRRIREKQGVSQEKLADLAGLHRTYVSSVERGQRNISLQNIEKLAKALAVSMAKLMPMLLLAPLQSPWQWIPGF
jgi:transcriptional regulator with XRE-family HTH domain